MHVNDFTVVRRKSGHAAEIRQGNRRVRKATAEEAAMQAEIDRLKRELLIKTDQASMADFKQVALRSTVECLRAIQRLHVAAKTMVKQLDNWRSGIGSNATNDLKDAVEGFEAASMAIKQELGIDGSIS